jgi:hypothetical protein
MDTKATSNKKIGTFELPAWLNERGSWEDFEETMLFGSTEIDIEKVHFVTCNDMIKIFDKLNSQGR